MTRVVSLAIAVAVWASLTLAAQEPQSALTHPIAGRWDVVVSGTGPFAGSGKLQLTMGGTTYSPIGLPLRIVLGTITIGPRTLVVNGTVDMRGALMFSVAESGPSSNPGLTEGVFGGGLSEGGRIGGTHVFTEAGKSFKTGWSGKRAVSDETR